MVWGRKLAGYPTMGYEYMIRGWYKSAGPVDLNEIQPLDGQFDWTEHDRLGLYLRVTGRERNYVLFATEAKHRSNYCLAALSAVMASSGGNGPGLVTVTGEWSYDGKDRFVIVRDGALLTIPTIRLYDPFSPWNAVYRWSHYMSRSVEELVTPDAGRLREALASRTSLKGWLYLHDHHTSDADGDRIIADLVHRCSELEGGAAFLTLLGQPYLLFGQNDVDAASALSVLANITAAREGTYGMLYCSMPDERSQVPVTFEQGRVLVLPAVSLATDAAAVAEPKLLPASTNAYEGLGSGFQAVPIRSPLDLHGLSREVARAIDAEPVAPHGGRREQSGVSGPCYLFEASALACILTTNDGQAHTDAHAGWPYLLILYLRGPAEPDLLEAHGRELIARLQAAGIEVGADRQWPD
jgi:hypothetical protein